MHTLAQVSHVLGSYLGPLFGLMLPEFEKIMADTSAYDLILDTLLIFRRLFKTGDENAHHYQAHFQKIQDIISRGINHEYSKVVSESLRVAGTFALVLRDPATGDVKATFQSVVQPLYTAIRSKL